MGILIMKTISLGQWLIFIPLCFLIIFIIQWRWYQRKNRDLIKVAAKLPIPVPCHSILGTWYDPDSKLFIPVYSIEVFTNSIMEGMKAAAKKPYSLFCMWAGPVPKIFAQKPQDVQVILTRSKALDKGPEYRFGKFVFGDGLLTSAGTKWKISRHYMNLVFHGRNVNCLTRVFNQSSRQLVQDMACHVGEEPLDVFQPLLTASVTSVCCILFGLEGQGYMKKNDFELGASITLRITEYIGERCFKPWLWSNQAFNFIWKKKLEDLEKMWIQFKSQPMKATENAEMLTVPKAYRKILHEHSMFSEADMEAEMKTILATGSDTTARGVGSCLIILGTHPHVQEELYNEIMSVLGPDDQDVTVEDLNALPYLDKVVKECLRISTTVIAVIRTISEDIKLSEYTIPKGGNVIISIIGLHFDPEVYPDPYVFNPERFSPENVAKRHPYSYLPFSGGPRSCIGKQYAIISMKIMLVHILRAYKISAYKSLQDLRYSFNITLQSIEGYKIKLEGRT